MKFVKQRTEKTMTRDTIIKFIINVVVNVVKKSL